MKIVLILLSIFIGFNFLNADNITIGYFNPNIGYPPEEIVRVSSIYFDDVNIPIIIQPVANLEIISDFVKNKTFDYIILSPMFIDIFKSDFRFNQLLYSIDENSNTTFKKILLTKKNISNMSDLKDKKVSASYYGTLGDRILNDHFFNNTSFVTEDFELLWLRKDLDGIFALIFNQVDGAIVSPLSLEALTRTNPAFVSDINTIYSSKGFAMLAMYDLLTDKNNIDIVKIFTDMSNTEKGQELLRTFGVYKWLKK